MNQLLKQILLAEKVLVRSKNQNLRKSWKMPIMCFSNYVTVTSCHVGHSNCQDSMDKNYTIFLRTITNKSGSYNNGKGTRTIVIPKTLGKKRMLREALEDRQRKLQRGVENVLEDRRAALLNTRRKIQEKGKLIMQDIKQTRDKMKEKIEEVIEKENVYTIPNFLCVTRIGLSPLLGYLIISEKFGYALAFMIVAGVSDWVDGWIARNYKSQSSKIGSFLDPMADKVLIGTLFLTLTYVDLIPFALTALIVGRDAILMTSGFVIRYRSIPPPRTLSRYLDVTYATAQLAPTFISKINTGIQLILVATTLGAPILGYTNHEFLQILWYITATSTVAAAISYIFSKETYKYLKTKEKVKNFRRK